MKIHLFVIYFFLLVFCAGTSAQSYRLNKSFGPYNSGPIRLIAINTDGNLVACNGAEGEISIIDADSGNIIKILKGHKGSLSSIGFSTNGKNLLSTSADGTVIVWNIKKGEAINTISGNTQNPDIKPVKFADFSNGEKEIIFGSEDKRLYKATNIYDPKKTEVSILFTAQQPISAGMYSPEKDFYIFSAGKFLYIKKDAQTTPAIYGTASGDITALAISPDGKLIAARCKNGLIDMWNTEKGSKTVTFRSASKTNEEDFTGLSFSDDGKYLVAGSNNGMPTVWNIEDSKSLFDLFGHSGKVIPVLFTGDKKVMITGSDDGSIKVWQMMKLPEDEKKDTAANSKRDSTDQLPAPDLKFNAENDSLPAMMADRGVTSTNNKPVVVSSRNITIYVWDNDQTDGDIISLNFNGKWVLEKYKLNNKKKKKIINVRLKPYVNNYLLLFAHNEGDVPPNTAGISIWDGFTETTLNLKSDLKSSDAVKLILK